MLPVDSFKTACNVWKWEASSINHLCDTIDPEVFDKVVQEIVECKKRNSHVLLTGRGACANVANKVATSLCTASIPAIYLAPTYDSQVVSSLARPGDLMVAFSKGGNTPVVLELAKLASANKTRIISVTSNPASPLALASSVIFKVTTPREADEGNTLATSSTLVMISAFDAICVAIQNIL